MTYSVKEIFYTLQGEGANAGRPAVFCRFSGCNLWSGLEKDRSSAVCQFCDTDFVGTNGTDGGKYKTAQELADQIAFLWQGATTKERFVVFTGGEPLLQLDDELIVQMHERGFQVAVETNGTLAPPNGIDWLCVSPKANSKIVVTSGEELKLVFPQLGLNPHDFELMTFKHFYLQPMDNLHQQENTQAAIAHCLANPQWKLSVQSHKIIGIR